MNNFSSKFQFGDQVSIDNGTVIGVVIGISFYSHDNQVQVSWWNNGALIEQWVSERRLTLFGMVGEKT